MPGPRIYTQSWERLKVAAKEMEARESEKSDHKPAAAEKPKRLKASGPFVIGTAVLALLSILMASLWIESQTRLVTAVRDMTDFKVRLELLQERMKKVEDERQRLEDENGRLSIQYEQRASELGQLDEELQALRAQKARSRTEPKQPVARTETQPMKAAHAPGTAQEPTPPTPREDKGTTLKPQTPERRDVTSYTVD
jgi:uncharacterized protein HemX